MRRRLTRTGPAGWPSPAGRRASARRPWRRAATACSATTPRGSSSRWRTNGQICRAGRDDRGARTQRLSRVRPARPRRLLLPDVLDQRCDAHQHGRARQSDQAHLLDLPRHAHDGHGHGERLDGPRHDEPSLGARAGRKPVGRRSCPSCRCSRSPAARICRRIRSSAATIYTQDPGRALISGKCEDVGAIVIQQFRGLAARAPVFLERLGGELARARRLLRSAFQHSVHGAGKDRSRQLPERAVMMRASCAPDRRSQRSR